MKLGYSTWGMPTVPIDTALQHLADLGFDGVEIAVLPRYTTDLSTLDNAERTRIANLLRQHNLTLSAIASHTDLLAPEPDQLDANIARLKTAINLAVDWTLDDQPPCIETTPGGKPEQWDSHKALLAERFGALAAYAGEHGVTLAIEPHIGAAIERPDQVRELIELVDSPYLRVNFDISHFNILGIPIETSVAALVDYAAHTHVKDERGLHPDFEFLIPGEGDFDYVRYLKAMQSHGYDGFITAEVSVMVQRRPNYDPLAAATQSYTTLARAFDTAGIARPA